MPLKVIGAGLGRTGTLSLKVALQRLGFAKCYHMSEVIAHPQYVRVCEAATRGEPVDWEELFRGYQATLDWPGCNFYREFMRRYPDAKVILTVRDPERWQDGARQTIYAVRTAFPRWGMPPRMRRLLAMTDRLIWDGVFGGRFEDKTHAIEVFHRHNEEVKRIVLPERLLVCEVREGWGPLCAFLGIPVPEGKSFPHVNDAEEFLASIRRMSRAMTAVASVVATALRRLRRLGGDPVLFLADTVGVKTAPEAAGRPPIAPAAGGLRDRLEGVRPGPGKSVHFEPEVVDEGS